MTRTTLEEYCRRIADEVLSGKLVPFLGAGVNLCARPEGFHWSIQQSQYLPNGGELAKYLALKFRYPTSGPCPNPNCPRAALDFELAKVAQFGETTRGAKDLYDNLRVVFAPQYSPTAVHHLLASMPTLLVGRVPSADHQLFVTTNYDDLLEQSFLDLHRPFDLLSYEAEGEFKGKFWHQPPDGLPVLIDKPNEWYPPVEGRPVVLKIHGSVDRRDASRDSYVITEDHYIDYLSHVELTDSIPIIVLDKLRNSHLLFLGYSLRDWNLRSYSSPLEPHKAIDGQVVGSFAIRRHCRTAVLASKRDRNYRLSAARVHRVSE